ncbi:cyclic nucleotide-binding domain-containing protein, partial [Paenibacillus riograndensis]
MQWIADQDKIRMLAGHNGMMEIFSSGAISGMELRRYSDGEAICSVGDRLEHMFILVEGRLKIHTLLPNGKSLLVRFARPMSVIGDVELLRQYPVKNEVVSMGESLLLAAGRALVLKEFEENTALLRFLVGELSHKMYTLGQTTALNLLYPLENRFASYLLSL